MKYNKDIVVKWFAEHGIHAVAEHRFADPRKWRFDFIVTKLNVNDATPLTKFGARLSNELGLMDDQIALEVEGGAWTNGRHTRGSGFVKDLEKYNEAAALGWRILRVTPDQLCMQETVDLIKRALAV